MKDKDVDKMDQNELKSELKELYRKINELEKDELDEISFDAKMKIKKKNSDGKIVEEREKSM